MATMTPEQAAYAEAAKRFRDQNWQNGGTTVTSTTGEQNLANVYNQKGNTAPMTPFIQQTLNTAAQQNGVQGASSQTQPVGNAVGTQPQDSGIGNAQNYINQLNDLRKNAAISALGKSKDAALSNLSSERSAIQPKYYDQRNQVAAGAQQQARNFAEFMASRGGTNSGANAQATLSNNMTTQGNLSTLGRQEAAAYTDIGRRTTDVQNAYESDVASATANAEADKMQALLQDYYTAQQRGDTQAQNQIQNAIAQSQLAMQQQGQQFNQNLATTQQQQNEANTKFAQSMQIDAVTYQKARDAITDKNYQKEFENNIKQQGFENALKLAVQQHQISNDNAQLAISRQNANTSSANGAASRENMRADNQRQIDALNLNNTQREFAATFMGELTNATSEADVKLLFDGNAADITRNLGPEAYNKLRNEALSQYQKVTPTEKQDTSAREKAIKDAQNDPRWLDKKVNRNTLIAEYEAYYK